MRIFSRIIVWGLIIIQLALAIAALMLLPTWDGLALALALGMVQVLTSLVLLPFLKHMTLAAARVGKIYFIGLLAFAVILALQVTDSGDVYEYPMIGLSGLLCLVMLLWLTLLGTMKKEHV